uniref:Secreted protein n=1 Tax=Steinernema glaseri TaxID=37863 RepID=A0A1I7YFG1_9BILA
MIPTQMMVVLVLRRADWEFFSPRGRGHRTNEPSARRSDHRCHRHVVRRRWLSPTAGPLPLSITASRPRYTKGTQHNTNTQHYALSVTAAVDRRRLRRRRYAPHCSVTLLHSALFQSNSLNLFSRMESTFPR